MNYLPISTFRAPEKSGTSLISISAIPSFGNFSGHVLCAFHQKACHEFRLNFVFFVLYMLKKVNGYFDCHMHFGYENFGRSKTCYGALLNVIFHLFVQLYDEVNK